MGAHQKIHTRRFLDTLLLSPVGCQKLLHNQVDNNKKDFDIYEFIGAVVISRDN